MLKVCVIVHGLTSELLVPVLNQKVTQAMLGMEGLGVKEDDLMIFFPREQGLGRKIYVEAKIIRGTLPFQNRNRILRELATLLVKVIRSVYESSSVYVDAVEASSSYRSLAVYKEPRTGSSQPVTMEEGS